jgi:hypothetical protein
MLEPLQGGVGARPVVGRVVGVGGVRRPIGRDERPEHVEAGDLGAGAVDPLDALRDVGQGAGGQAVVLDAEDGARGDGGRDEAGGEAGERERGGGGDA